MSMQKAEEVVLEVNVSLPLENRLRTFIKRVKYWLIARQTLIEEGEAFTIPPDILLESDTAPYYSRETPTVKVLATKPKGNVWVNTDTSTSIDFKPSRPVPVVVVKVSDREPPLDRHPQWGAFLAEMGFTPEKYQALNVRNKQTLLHAFRIWLTRKRMDAR